MPWVTQLGAALDYPLALHARAVRAGADADVMEVLRQAQRIHEAACRMDAEIRTLRQENLRLQHENNFMLRLIQGNEK